MLRTCKTCSNAKALGEFYKRKSGTSFTECSECVRERTRRNRDAKIEHYRAYDRERNKSAKRQAEHRRALKLEKERNPTKYKARTALSNAIRLGHIYRPDRCAACSARGPVEGHHADYTRPLTVSWLCLSCHTKEHKMIRSGERPELVY